MQAWAQDWSARSARLARLARLARSVAVATALRCPTRGTSSSRSQGSVSREFFFSLLIILIFLSGSSQKIAFFYFLCVFALHYTLPWDRFLFLGG